MILPGYYRQVGLDGRLIGISLFGLDGRLVGISLFGLDGRLIEQVLVQKLCQRENDYQCHSEKFFKK